MEVQPLRRYDNPDLSDFVVHLTSRPGYPNSDVDEAIKDLTPEERLKAILGGGSITAHRPFFGYWPDRVVCFTECTPAGIRTLITEDRYEPWGIAFTKDFVFRRGGGPAFYVRGDVWHEVERLPPSIRAFATKLWPGARVEPGEDFDRQLGGRNEWTHEREWRVMGNGNPPAFRFESDDVAFVIVGDAASAIHGYRNVVVDAATGKVNDLADAWGLTRQGPVRAVR